MRLPNILGIESKPFDPETFEVPKFSSDKEEETQKKILNPETIIRWRYAKDENGIIIVQFYYYFEQ